MNAMAGGDPQATAPIKAEMQQRWIEMGVVPIGGSPADAEKYFVGEREKWGKVIKAAGIRGD